MLAHMSHMHLSGAVGTVPPREHPLGTARVMSPGWKEALSSPSLTHQVDSATHPVPEDPEPRVKLCRGMDRASQVGVVAEAASGAGGPGWQ